MIKKRHYLFKRDTSFTTAYIGSSNLSNAALTSGLEWNIKVTEKDSFDIIKKFQATFDSYWYDKEIPHTISKYYLKKFSNKGISLPREFYSVFKIVD